PMSAGICSILSFWPATTRYCLPPVFMTAYMGLSCKNNFGLICQAKNHSKSGACASRRGSGPVVGVDADVLVGEVAGIDGVADLAASERDAHGDLGLLHDALAVFLGIGGMATAVAGHQRF